MAPAAPALRSASSASTGASPAALSRRQQQQQTRIRSVARASSSSSASSASIPSTSTSSTSAAAALPILKPILILFDLDNAPIPSQTPEIASAVINVLARKMEDLLLGRGGGVGGGGGGVGGVGGGGGASPPSFPVRAAAFANEATVRSRPGLSRCLSSAGVSLVTVPSTRNAADAMVVSCAAGALSSADGGEGGGGGGGLSGLIFCSADNYFSEFLRYASHKGVRTFVAGDFDNRRRKRGGRGGGSGGAGGGSGGAGGGRRGRRSGEKTRSGSGESTTGSSSDDDGAPLVPWRKKELPASADGAALWSDVLSEANELLLLNR